MSITKSIKLQLAKFLQDFVEITTDKGILYSDVEPAVNSDVYIQADDGTMIPAPSDIYTTETQIITVVDGVVATIEDKEVKEEEKPTEEIVPDEKMEDIKPLEVKTDNGVLYVQSLEIGVDVLDDKGNAVADGDYNTDTDCITVKDGKIASIENLDDMRKKCKNEEDDKKFNENLQKVLNEFKKDILDNVDNKIKDITLAKPAEKELESNDLSNNKLDEKFKKALNILKR